MASSKRKNQATRNDHPMKDWGLANVHFLTRN